MRTHRALATALVTALSLAAAISCGGDFEPGSRVTKLRVLAVRADPPFARPGEEVRLEALVFDPAGRTLSWGWSSCFEPDAPGALPCFNAAPPPAAGEAGAFTLRVPDDALAPPEASPRLGATLGVNLVVCPGTITEGPTQGLRAGCVDEAGTKHVTVRANDRNENPRLEGLSWDDADWPEGLVPEVDACDTDGNDFDKCDRSLAHRIAPSLGPPEQGVDELGVAFDEDQIVQFYATEGVFEDEVRAAPSTSTRWVARRLASGRTVTFWVVARDDRGGVSWVTRQVRVR
jgi:hypothetical protein